MTSFVNAYDVKSAEKRYACLKIANNKTKLNMTCASSHRCLGSPVVRKKEFQLTGFISLEKNKSFWAKTKLLIFFCLINYVLAYQIEISAIFTHVRNFYLTPLARAVPALGKDKKELTHVAPNYFCQNYFWLSMLTIFAFRTFRPNILITKRTNKQKIIRLEFQIYRLFFT